MIATAADQKDFQIGVDVFSIETYKRPEQVTTLLAELSRCRNLALGTKAMYGAVISEESVLSVRESLAASLGKVGKVERLLQCSSPVNSGEEVRLEIPSHIRYWKTSDRTTDAAGNPLVKMFYERSPETLPLVLRPSKLADGRVFLEFAQQAADILRESIPEDGSVAPPPVTHRNMLNGMARLKPGSSFLIAYSVQRNWSRKQYLVTIATPTHAV
jgi:hypothetical protein